MSTNRGKLNEVFGDPFKHRLQFERDNMMLWNCQQEFPSLPFRRMYINQYIEIPLRVTFARLSELSLMHELKTFDGCWNIRSIRGYPGVASIHSWGLAVDFNAAHNPLGMKRADCIAAGLTPFTICFLDVWRETGWVCGADFTRCDLMHFQYTKEFF